jgi:radical SAM superfamily enzyme YgiQ (UPF0313 family)
MKNLLIISFDFIREGECQSFAIGSLLSSLKTHKGYGNDFNFNWYAFNLLSIESLDLNHCLQSELFQKYDLKQYTHIAISCYVWNDHIVNPLIEKLIECGFPGEIILGGYEISYSEKSELKALYPKADYLIQGYAEAALLDIITGVATKGVVSKSVDFSLLPSPYLSNTLSLSQNINKVRWETKRGCPYKCNFCAHRDLTGKRVNYHLLDKAFAELSLFKLYQVKKINVLDPIFNIGKDYLKILEEASKIGLNSELSLQVRPELVTDDFLNRVENLNVCLEFGIQTLNETENKIIKRRNNYTAIFQTLNKVKERKIKYEISLIYGLPFQTITTFSQSIETLKSMGCSTITAFPLMLLKGTELYSLKNEFAFKEVVLGPYKIPTVIESNTYSEADWWKMYELAIQLNPNNRII